MDTPYGVVALSSAGSTQDEARTRFAGRPLLVLADRQTAGRGRSGARWEHAERGVAASLAFTPAWPKAAWPRLTLLAGLAARDAIAAEPGTPEVGLKWPNDLMAGSAKVGGIITESDGFAVVVGFGLNLWWPPPIEGAGALFDGDPGRSAARSLAEAWASGLLDLAACHADEWPRARFTRHCVTVGRRVAWNGGSGLAVGIAADGGLEVDDGTRILVVRSGAVRGLREET